MQNFRLLFLILLVNTALMARGQQSEVVLKYIETYRDMAVLEMQRTGIPAAIKLAQGIHESMAGTSDLVKRSNNHFGIKCKSNWTGESVRHTDDAPNECFRKYNDPMDSYRDHSEFLRNSKRYASLFELDPTDYIGWANGLKKAGYATNPKYPQVIINLIQKYQLQDYTMIAMGSLPPRKGMTAGQSLRGDEEPVALSADFNEVAVEAPKRDYPTGEFKINETRVIYAKAGTSFLAIAQQHNISLAKIFEFNDQPESETVSNDQLVFLQRKRKSGMNEIHQVRAGETIWHIAQAEGIRLESLLEYNHLTREMQPAEGEQLYLRKKAPSMPKLSKKSMAVL